MDISGKFTKGSNTIKPVTADGCGDIMKELAAELCMHPDHAGKDKELWCSASQFLHDYFGDIKVEQI